MASIEPRINKNGVITSYRIEVLLGEDSQGRKIRERISYRPEAKTPKKAEKEVLKFALDWEKEVKNGSAFIDGNKTTFSELVSLWEKNSLNPNVLKGSLTQSVKEGYINTLNYHVIPEIGHMKLNSITSEHIDKIVNRLLEEGKRPSTIRNVFGCVRSCFNYAVRKKKVFENPCLRCEPLPEIKNDHKYNVFNEDQVERFLKDALTREYEFEVKRESHRPYSYIEHTEVSLQFRTYFTLAVFGGFRRGEMVGLNWEDIDSEQRTITIRRSVSLSKEKGNHVQYIKDPKTEAGKRTVKVPEICFKLLSEWEKEQRQICLQLGTAWDGHRGRDFQKNPVFIQTDTGKRMNVQTPTAKFRKILKAYNQAVTKEGHEEDCLPIIRLHELRHTCATHLLANGVDIETVSQRIGHSKASFTLDVYGHALPEKDDTASDVLEKIFKMA